MLKRLVVIFCITGAIGFAQYPGCTVADIPFAFEAVNTTLPAGEYTFCSSGANHQVIHVTSEAKKVLGIVFNAKYPTASNEVSVSFNKYGDRIFVSQIRNPSIWLEFPKSRNERTLVTSKFIASRLEKIIIAARRW